MPSCACNLNDVGTTKYYLQCLSTSSCPLSFSIPCSTYMPDPHHSASIKPCCSLLDPVLTPTPTAPTVSILPFPMQDSCSGSTQLSRPHCRSIRNTMHPPCLRLPAFLSSDDPSSSNYTFSNSPIDRHSDLQTSPAASTIRPSHAYACHSIALSPALACFLSIAHHSLSCSNCSNAHEIKLPNKTDPHMLHPTSSSRSLVNHKHRAPTSSVSICIPFSGQAVQLKSPLLQQCDRQTTHLANTGVVTHPFVNCGHVPINLSTANCPSQSRSPQLAFDYMPLTPPQERAHGQYRRKHDSKQKVVQQARNAKRRRPQPCLIPRTSGQITLLPQLSPEPIGHLRNTDQTAC